MSSSIDAFDIEVVSAVTKELREDVRSYMTNSRKRVACPVCDQSVKAYKRSLSRVGIVVLIEMAKRTKAGKYINVNQEIMRRIISGEIYAPFKVACASGDYTRSRHWDLIEPQVSDVGDRRITGTWRLTAKGRDFVKGRIRIPMYVTTYQGEVLQFSGPKRAIKESMTGYLWQRLLAGKDE